jgi:hypothetical protein
MYIKKTRELLNIQVMRFQGEFDNQRKAGEGLAYRCDEYWSDLKAKMKEKHAVELRITGCEVSRGPGSD